MKIFYNRKETVSFDNQAIISESVYSQIYEKYTERYSGLSGKYLHQTELFLAFQSIDFQDKKILDIGTGTGRLIDYIKNKTSSVVGIDISKGMVNYCQRKFREDKKITILQMDSLRLDFPDCTFDIVLNFGYENTKKLSPYFKEISRVLKKDGFFLFSVLNDTPLFNFYDTVAMKSLGIYTEFPRVKFRKEEIDKILNDSGLFPFKTFNNFCLFPPYLLPFKKLDRINKIIPFPLWFINFLILINRLFSSYLWTGYELIFYAKKA